MTVRDTQPPLTMGDIYSLWLNAAGCFARRSHHTYSLTTVLLYFYTASALSNQNSGSV